MKFSTDDIEIEINDRYIDIMIDILVNKMIHDVGIKEEYLQYISYTNKDIYSIISIKHSLITKLLCTWFPNVLLHYDIPIGTPIYQIFLNEISHLITKHKTFKKALLGYNCFENDKQSTNTTKQLIKRFQNECK